MADDDRDAERLERLMQQAKQTDNLKSAPTAPPRNYNTMYNPPPPHFSNEIYEPPRRTEVAFAWKVVNLLLGSIWLGAGGYTMFCTWYYLWSWEQRVPILIASSLFLVNGLLTMLVACFPSLCLVMTCVICCGTPMLAGATFMVLGRLGVLGDRDIIGVIAQGLGFGAWDGPWCITYHIVWDNCKQLVDEYTVEFTTIIFGFLFFVLLSGICLCTLGFKARGPRQPYNNGYRQVAAYGPPENPNYDPGMDATSSRQYHRQHAPQQCPPDYGYYDDGQRRVTGAIVSGGMVRVGTWKEDHWRVLVCFFLGFPPLWVICAMYWLCCRAKEPSPEAKRAAWIMLVMGLLFTVGAGVALIILYAVVWAH